MYKETVISPNDYGNKQLSSETFMIVKNTKLTKMLLLFLLISRKERKGKDFPSSSPGPIPGRVRERQRR